MGEYVQDVPRPAGHLPPGPKTDVAQRNALLLAPTADMVPVVRFFGSDVRPFAASLCGEAGSCAAGLRCVLPSAELFHAGCSNFGFHFTFVEVVGAHDARCYALERSLRSVRHNVDQVDPGNLRLLF